MPTIFRIKDTVYQRDYIIYQNTKQRKNYEEFYKKNTVYKESTLHFNSHNDLNHTTT